MAEVVNAIVADAPVTGVRIITDSWGLCEPRGIAGGRGRNQLGAAAGRGLRHHLRGRIGRCRRLRLRRLPPAGRGRPGRAAVRHRRRRHGPATQAVRQPARGRVERHHRLRRWRSLTVLAAAGLAGGCGRQEQVLERPSAGTGRLPARVRRPARLSRLLHDRGLRARRMDDAGRDECLRAASGRHRGRHEQLLAGPRRRAAGIRQPVPVRQLRRRSRPRSATSPPAPTIPTAPGRTRPRPATTRPAASARRWPVRWPPTWPRTRPLSRRSPQPGSRRCRPVPDAAARALHHPARRAQR